MAMASESPMLYVPGRGARLLANETLHRPLQSELVASEVDARPRLWVGDERDLIERAQLIEKRRRGHRGPGAATLA